MHALVPPVDSSGRATLTFAVLHDLPGELVEDQSWGFSTTPSSE